VFDLEKYGVAILSCIAIAVGMILMITIGDMREYPHWTVTTGSFLCFLFGMWVFIHHRQGAEIKLRFSDPFWLVWITYAAAMTVIGICIRGAVKYNIMYGIVPTVLTLVAFAYIYRKFNQTNTSG